MHFFKTFLLILLACTHLHANFTPSTGHTSISYNTQGMPIAKTDAKNQTTNFAYKKDTTIPLLQSVTLPNSASTEYDYNTLNQKTIQKDALGRETTFTYTSTEELQTQTLPQGEVTRYSYDTFGKQTNIEDYKNQTTQFVYDSNDNLVRIEYVDGNTLTYTYTPSGQINQVTDNSGTITYTYDNRGRVSSITNQDNQSINYTYDNVGNITKIQTPTTTISKTYTKRNELQSVTDATGTTSYIYDALGREIEIQHANNAKTIKEYNSKNQIINITHTNADAQILSSFSYDYDANSNRTKIVEQDQRTIEYTYDNTNRLTSESVTNDPDANNYTITYNYDAVGNLKEKTLNTQTTSFTYNKNDQLIDDGVNTYTYDANGNLISKGVNSYTYDSKNRLVNYSDTINNITYKYDANNNRIAKEINNQTTNYLIDPNTPYAKVLQESNATDTISYTYGNTLINQISGVNTYTYHTDALGSTRYLTDQNTQTKAKYTYDAYGNLLKPTNQEVTNNFLYTGEQLDRETDNYYLRARYYDPSNTRFITRDTYDGAASNPITQNHYLYGNANPAMYVDPSGNMSMLSVTNSVVLLGSIAKIGSIGLKAGQKLFKNNQRVWSIYRVDLPSGNTYKHAFIWAKNIKTKKGLGFHVQAEPRDMAISRKNDIAIKGVFGVYNQPRVNTLNGITYPIRSKVRVARLYPLAFQAWRFFAAMNVREGTTCAFAYNTNSNSCINWSTKAAISAKFWERLPF